MMVIVRVLALAVITLIPVHAYAYDAGTLSEYKAPIPVTVDSEPPISAPDDSISASEFIEGIVGLFVLIGLYLFPTLVASIRQHHQGLAILVLNLLLGWTGLGWVLALIWACTAVRKQAPA